MDSCTAWTAVAVGGHHGRDGLSGPARPLAGQPDRARRRMRRRRYRGGVVAGRRRGGDRVAGAGADAGAVQQAQAAQRGPAGDRRVWGRHADRSGPRRTRRRQHMTDPGGTAVVRHQNVVRPPSAEATAVPTAPTLRTAARTGRPPYRGWLVQLFSASARRGRGRDRRASSATGLPARPGRYRSPPAPPWRRTITPPSPPLLVARPGGGAADELATQRNRIPVRGRERSIPSGAGPARPWPVRRYVQARW